MLLYRYSQQLGKSRAHTLYDTFVQVLPGPGGLGLGGEPIGLGKYFLIILDVGIIVMLSDVPPKKTWFSKGIFQNVLQGGDCFCDFTQVLSLLATQSLSIFSLLTGDVSLSDSEPRNFLCGISKVPKISSIAYDTKHCPFSNPQTPGPDSPHPRVGADARWQGVCCQPFWVGQVLI